jgi:hypothetical protein
MSIDLFLVELESQLVSYNKYKKHKETLFMYSIIEPDTINFDEYITLNPVSANRTAKFICDLADKYGVRMTGEAKPFWVGPSVTQRGAFFRGMKFERLLRWYKYYGFVVTEDNKIIREPNYENKS